MNLGAIESEQLKEKAAASKARETQAEEGDVQELNFLLPDGRRASSKYKASARRAGGLTACLTPQCSSMRGRAALTGACRGKKTITRGPSTCQAFLA
jgi:hypothetical protein